ncbi:competence type IV pilus major pilin ComGC [Paucisalibacillus globulus]|uniref:competence type IV pilus major pilin ComGC n=1 Tax=Paucisalibacillus globulus TaxID=351095 RepID=UPI000BB7DD38|nr:type II secretion system protein [Paucisalibacillus globulus]
MLKQTWKKLKKEKGFTLVELLAVIAILGIIVAIAIPTIGNVIDSSEKKADEANIKLMEDAARLAYTSNVDPANGTAYTLSELEDSGFLSEIPTKPGTKEKYTGTIDVTKESESSGAKFKYTE